MIKLFLSHLRPFATWKVILFLGGLSSLLLLYVAHLNTKLKGASGGYGIPDFEFGYSYASLSAIFSSYGEAIVIFRQIEIIDLVLPMLYGLTLSLLTLRLWAGTRFEWLAMLPLHAADFDYTENLALFILSHLHPNLPIWLVLASSTINILKYVTFILAVLALLGGLALAGYRRSPR